MNITSKILIKVTCDKELYDKDEIDIELLYASIGDIRFMKYNKMQKIIKQE